MKGLAYDLTVGICSKLENQKEINRSAVDRVSNFSRLAGCSGKRWESDPGNGVSFILVAPAFTVSPVIVGDN